MGAIVGALVGDAVANGQSRWTANATVSIAHAEALLNGEVVPLDLSAAQSVPVAIGLASTTAPLLIDSSTVEMIDHVAAWLNRREAMPFDDPKLAAAATIANEHHGRFVAAVQAMPTESAALTGALVGLHGGIGAIPARLVAELRCPDGRRDRRYLSRLCDRLLDVHRIDWYDPRNRRGPKEVLPGVWVTNIFGLEHFAAEHPDGVIISLCDIEGRLGDHRDQLTFHLDDTPKADANPSIDLVIDDVMTEIRSARNAGRPVLVHCRHGASRTGLILRLLLIEEHDLDADDALIEAQCVWPHTSTWNKAWARKVDSWVEQRTTTRPS